MRRASVVWAAIVLVDVSCGLGVVGALPSTDIVLDAGDERVDVDAGSVADAHDPTTDSSTVDVSLPPPSPGEVVCGAARCNTSRGEFCCVGKETCFTDPIACGTWKQVECDEPADCTDRCCLTRNSAEATRPSSRCMSTCNGDEIIRVCRFDSDCNTNNCVAVTCLGRVFGTCNGELPPTCRDGG